MDKFIKEISDFFKDGLKDLKISDIKSILKNPIAIAAIVILLVLLVILLVNVSISFLIKGVVLIVAFLALFFRKKE